MTREAMPAEPPTGLPRCDIGLPGRISWVIGRIQCFANSLPVLVARRFENSHRPRQMLLCRRSLILVTLFTALSTPHALAQSRDGGDQPGYVPNPQDEQLDPRWQKTVVFYRTSEAPGTIIVHTNERYLYVVQPGGRALRYGIGVGREG